MSQYTTGEMAKLCGVTVRTVQYYDKRGILVPSALTEGGRRQYSEDDLRRMKVICFLRELGLSIEAIGRLLSEDDPGSVIALLLDEQAAVLREEAEQAQRKLDGVLALKREIRDVEHFSVESIGDIAHTMENRKNLRKMRLTMLFTGIPLALIQWAGIALWIIKGQWQLFAVWAVLAILYGIWMSKYYFTRVAYICPQCHEVFTPPMKEAFFAPHTPKTRKLTCPKCGRHGYCVETWNPNRA